MVAKLLGAANGSGATLTITLTDDVPAAGILSVAFAQMSHPTNGDLSAKPVSATDTNGIAWTVATLVDPLIGLTRQNQSGGTQSLQTGSIVRSCTAGDLHAGDSIIVTFDPIVGEVLDTCGLVVYTESLFVTVEQDGSISYSNNASWPDFGQSAQELTWLAPPVSTFGDPVIADRTGILLTAMAAYPATAGFTPHASTKIGEIASGVCSIAAAYSLMRPGHERDPGGTWPPGAQMLVGNYQISAWGGPGSAVFRSRFRAGY